LRNSLFLNDLIKAGTNFGYSIQHLSGIWAFQVLIFEQGELQWRRQLTCPSPAPNRV
jgi:hypothetical protein